MQRTLFIVVVDLRDPARERKTKRRRGGEEERRKNVGRHQFGTNVLKEEEKLE